MKQVKQAAEAVEPASIDFFHFSIFSKLRARLGEVMTYLESPCNVEGCLFKDSDPGHSIIMHELLDMRVSLQVKADHWLFTETIAKVVELAELDYPSIRALGDSIKRWAKRNNVLFV